MDLVRALTPVKAELRCGECGYGVVTSQAPDVCPMCHASSWEPVPWRPFSSLSDFAAPHRARGPEAE